MKLDWSTLADRLLWVNLAWYGILAVAFALAGNLGKTLYFLGAAILTVGVTLL